MISFTTNSENETEKIAAIVGKHIKRGTTLALMGDLGAGKTLFTKQIAKTLEVKSEVTSPTFNLMNVYEGICPIYHFDLYRLDNVSELYDIGFYEYVESDEGISVIEWADKFRSELPVNTVNVNFEVLDENSRRISFSGKGEIAEDLIEMLGKGID